MQESQKTWLVWLPWIILLVAALAVVILTLAGVSLFSPLRLIGAYPISYLSEEASVMAECAECHDTSKSHTCYTCHDEHGSVEMPLVPFNVGVWLTGDVAAEKLIPVNDILPYRDQPHTQKSLLEFLAEQGVTEFESVTFASNDGGFNTIERANINDEAVFVPHTDGIRFSAENLHISVWLRGITRIIVVGNETPLRIAGQDTSYGRLLLGPTLSVTVEQADVMLKSETDGQVRRAKTAYRREGAPVDILAGGEFQSLTVIDSAGATNTLSATEAADAIVTRVDGSMTLVMPARGYSLWLKNVVEIRFED
jgi:hypothetical protein